jgi:hypothetical protein
MPTDIRLDEGDDGTWVVVKANVLKTEGSDIMLDSPERRGNHGGALRRAMVHDGADGLTLNFNHDYSGGVTINSARLNLMPIPQVDDKLPMRGEVGDLVMLRRRVQLGNQTVSDQCSLWLCVPDGQNVNIVGGALWREVSLGDPVRGSE